MIDLRTHVYKVGWISDLLAPLDSPVCARNALHAIDIPRRSVGCNNTHSTAIGAADNRRVVVWRIQATRDRRSSFDGCLQ